MLDIGPVGSPCARMKHAVFCFQRSLKRSSPFSRNIKIWAFCPSLISVFIWGYLSFDFLINLRSVPGSELSFSLMIMIWLWSFLVTFLNVNFSSSLSLDPTDSSINQSSVDSMDSTEDNPMAIDRDNEISRGDCASDAVLNDSVGTYSSENEANLGILRRQLCSSTQGRKKKNQGTRSRGWSPALGNKKQEQPPPLPTLDLICHGDEFLATCTGPEVPLAQDSDLLLVLNCVSGSS